MIPPDVAEAFFGRHFKVEGDQAVAYDSAGNKVYSTTRPGELASFDEAVEFLVDRYPNKAAILKGSGASGGGAGPSNGGSGGKTASRAQFDAMGPSERMTFAKAGGKVVD